MADQFDVVILGGGSSAEVIAGTLLDAGRSVAIVEERLLGGECPYYACMPSKALLHVAHAHRASGDRGHAAAWRRAVEHRDEVAAHRNDTSLVRDYEKRGAVVIRGHGRITGEGAVEVGGRVLRGTDIVINTGSSPMLPPIEGLEELPGRWSSEDALSRDELPERLAILGGAAVGCELADVYSSFGAQVTLIESADRLLAKEEPFCGELVEAALRERGIAVITGATVEVVSGDGDAVHLSLKDGRSISADRLLVATGTKPRTGEIGLETVGIDPGDKGIEIDDHCRAGGRPHLWAAGDVTGILPFTHTANYHARAIAANILGADAVVRHDAIPHAVYTEPPVAGVGLTEEAAREKLDAVAVAEMDLQQTARSSAEAGAPGRIKAIADASRGVIVGAAAAGPHADDLIAEATLAIRAAVPLSTLTDVVHAFPTYAEAWEPVWRELAGKAQAESQS